jgi:hypothetical protein
VRIAVANNSAIITTYWSSERSKGSDFVRVDSSEKRGNRKSSCLL